MTAFPLHIGSGPNQPQKWFSQYREVTGVSPVIPDTKELPASGPKERSYSNSEYTVLAEIVERVGGQSMHGFGRENLNASPRLSAKTKPTEPSESQCFLQPPAAAKVRRTCVSHSL